MLIDDDVDDRDIFLTAFRNDIHLFDLNCHQWKGCFEQPCTHAGLPQIIFLDLNMPLMNGSQFVIEVGRKNPFSKIPIAILFTSAGKDTQPETNALGAMQFIPKPDWVFRLGTTAEISSRPPR